MMSQYKPIRTKVFLSFSGLLVALRDKKIKPEELNHAVFYFGCSREHVFSDEGENEDVVKVFGKDFEAGQSALRLIRIKVLKAEARGWAGFRCVAFRANLIQLNNILRAARLPSLQETKALAQRYTYRAVEIAAFEQNHPAEFIW